MQVYLGTKSYDIFQSGRAGSWAVSMNDERFDLFGLRKVQAPHGCCVLRLVTETEAREWADANPISNPTGIARIREVLDHYAFIIKFRLGLAE